MLCQRDYEMFNWFTSTHPDSHFTKNLIAARVVGERRLNLLNNTLTAYWPDGRSEARTLADAGAAHAVLEGDLGIEIERAEIERIWARLPS